MFTSLLRRIRQIRRQNQAALHPPAPDIVSPPEVAPKFFSTLNLEMRELPDGRWVAIDTNWKVGYVRPTSSDALLTLWAHLYQYGVAAMPDPSDQADEADSDES
jgi:hypothetical protein